MRHLQWAFIAAFLQLCHLAIAEKAVFAHFMVDNAGGWTQSKWETEMILAATANIDAFALNIAAGDSVNDEQIANAFAAANARSFKLFFSFDYAGNGAWAKADVLSLLGTYAHNGAYFQHDGAKPLVSTFEGPGSAADWVEIKNTIGCFFIPDWSSLGAKAALELEDGVADGLFSWAAWSWGGLTMDTYTDASYLQYLNGKPYMMAASPWFYTNLPGYSKNWMWPLRTMSLWADRWNEILFLKPDYVEIISWNDFGESHYIGTTYDSPPFEDDKATFDYVTDIHHDALRWPLAVWAEQYKTNVSTITEESLVLNYMLHDVSCDDGDTVVNTATQLQYEWLPSTVLGDRYIGYMATLGSEAEISVTVGGVSISATFIYKPVNGGAGVYYGYAYLEDGVSGEVSAKVIRNSATIITVAGEAIGGCRDDGYANFNLYVTGAFADAKVSAETANLGDLVCILGTGAEGFSDICSTSCSLGYCPYTACVCKAMGTQPELPPATGTAGYAKSDTNYIGLCSFLYNYGYKFDDYCSTTEQDLSTPSVSPFLPYACTAGTGNDDWTEYGVDGLCSWLCGYGYCPLRICDCTDTGALVALDNVQVTDVDAVIYPSDDNLTLDNMCNFACDYDICVCEESDESDPACDWTLEFASLSDLAAASGSYSVFCNEIYTLQILSDDMTTTLSDYDDVNDGYDALFGYYVKYVKNFIQPSIDAFMIDDGWTYFDCTWTSSAGSTDDLDCPDLGDIDSDNHITENGMTVTWKFKNETGFYSVLSEQYGVEADWVKLDSTTATTNCVPSGISCIGVVCTTSRPCLATYLNFDNFPMKADDVTVPNPKDIFSSAGSAINDLPNKIDATVLDIMLGQWDGSVLDPVQVMSLPVALAQAALSSMKQVKDLGETEKEDEQKEVITWIITAVLALVPFVGTELAAASGLASVARAIAIAGEAANAGYDIYTIVEDPDSALMSIFGMLLGAGGVALAARDADGFAKMGTVRRGMSSDISKMGDTVEEQASSIQKIVRSCDL